MNAHLEHIIINVSDPKKSFPFYKDLLGYFGYQVIMEAEDHLGMKKKGDVSFWFVLTDSEFIPNGFHRKNTGLNHFCFNMDSKEDIDKFTEEYLKPRGIETLYETPKAFPEYTPNYYAVFFEDPDRMKIEIAIS